jgi:hypothetical protein
MIETTMHRCAGSAASAIRRMLAACAAISLLGCATNPNGTIERTTEDRVERGKVLHSLNLEPALEDRILALDPDHISDYDVRLTLAAGPTPRIILVHASIYPVYLIMSSFATFLEGMGYPGEKLRDPADGAYSQSPYGSSERLAGEIAWYYEHDGVRPMIVGHSQGGMQAIKVLYTLAGAFERKVAVWNAATDAAEDRFSIVDPLDGSKRPVVGLSVTYATAVGAGGAAFMLPNQWDMLLRLRTIPDTVDDFTGFAIQGDMIAVDFPRHDGRQPIPARWSGDGPQRRAADDLQPYYGADHPRAGGGPEGSRLDQRLRPGNCGGASGAGRCARAQHTVGSRRVVQHQEALVSGSADADPGKARLACQRPRAVRVASIRRAPAGTGLEALRRPRCRPVPEVCAVTSSAWREWPRSRP